MRGDHHQRKSFTTYSKTQQTFCSQPKQKWRNPHSAIDSTTPQHVQPSFFQTQSLLSHNPNNRRRSYAQNSLQNYLFTQPVKCVTPQRSRTSIAKQDIHDKLRDMISKSREKKGKVRPRRKNRRHSKVSLLRTEEQQLIGESLLQIEQEQKYHQKFIEVITHKRLELYPQEKPKPRERSRVQKSYTEAVYQPPLLNQKIPDYLKYTSSFYSRSKRRCFQQVADVILIQKEAEADERAYFSYLQFVADLKAKRRFQEAAKAKKDLDGVKLMKSKQKILSLWKHGSRNREQTKALIEQILREKRLI